MSHATGMTRRIRGAGSHSWATLALVFTLGACSDGTPEPSAPRLPEQISAAIHDVRIGRGVPERFRLAGTEHNRLSLFTLRKLRPEAGAFRDPVRRCEAIQRVLFAQAPHTAKAAGIPAHANDLRTIARAAMQDLPGCATVAASMPALLAGPVAAEVEGDSAEISPAAFAVIDRLQVAVGSATSVAAVDAALQSATASAAAFNELDATAVYAVVAQTQASVVLWEPGGAGWMETAPFPEEQSLFGRARATYLSDFDNFLLAVSADVAGCAGSLRFLRWLPIAWPPQVLIAACGFSAAGASVYTAYKIFHEEE